MQGVRRSHAGALRGTIARALIGVARRRRRLCWAMQRATGRQPLKRFQDDKVPVLSQRWQWARRPKVSAG